MNLGFDTWSGVLTGLLKPLQDALKRTKPSTPTPKEPDDFATALDAAQYYLDWYDMRGRKAERIMIGLKPGFHLEILCTDGTCVAATDERFFPTLVKVLRRELGTDRIRVLIRKGDAP